MRKTKNSILIDDFNNEMESENLKKAESLLAEISRRGEHSVIGAWAALINNYLEKGNDNAAIQCLDYYENNVSSFGDSGLDRANMYFVKGYIQEEIHNNFLKALEYYDFCIQESHCSGNPDKIASTCYRIISSLLIREDNQEIDYVKKVDYAKDYLKEAQSAIDNTPHQYEYNGCLIYGVYLIYEFYNELDKINTLVKNTIDNTNDCAWDEPLALCLLKSLKLGISENYAKKAFLKLIEIVPNIRFKNDYYILLIIKEIHDKDKFITDKELLKKLQPHPSYSIFKYNFSNS